MALSIIGLIIAVFGGCGLLFVLVVQQPTTVWVPIAAAGASMIICGLVMMAFSDLLRLVRSIEAHFVPAKPEQKPHVWAP
jgi:MFS superfamily sulfate permease-like transporter